MELSWYVVFHPWFFRCFAHIRSAHKLSLTPMCVCVAASIKRAFRNGAKVSHPDKNPSKEEEFKRLVAANEVLSNPKKRLIYDAAL